MVKQEKPDAYDALRQKVLGIFNEMIGKQAERLDGLILSTPAMDAITVALEEEYGLEKASDIAFHMADWNADAALVVAVLLYPERFTKEEIRDGIDLFLLHAPNHIHAACQLTNTYVWDNFPDSDEVE